MSAFGRFSTILWSLAGTAGVLAYARYRGEVREIRSGLEAGSKIAKTAAGAIEYADEGNGDALLLIHGAGGGYDQGLLIAHDLFDSYRVIAPSRFGYLRTPAPEDSSPAAQADAHAALLDHLGIHKAIVVGVSAGGPSAIEIALRYPERVSALILLVPRTYDPSRSIGVDDSVKSRAVLGLMESSADFLYWIAMWAARGAVVRFLGVPPEVEAHASEKDRRSVTQVMRSVLPLSHRVHGIAVDSAIELSPWPLERVQAPTLIVSAKDDLFETLPGARFTAEHIPGAELKVLERGGHLMVGQTDRVRTWIGDFLRRHGAGRGKVSQRVRKRPAIKVLEPVA